MWGWCCSARIGRLRRSASWRRWGLARRLCFRAGMREIDERGAQRQAEFLAAAGRRGVGQWRRRGRPCGSWGRTHWGGQHRAGDGFVGQFGFGAGFVATRGSGRRLAEWGHGGGAPLPRAAQGVGFSTLLATGNEADVDVCDAVEFLLDDEDTRVIALYLESVRSARPFSRIRGAGRQQRKAARRLQDRPLGSRRSQPRRILAPWPCRPHVRGPLPANRRDSGRHALGAYRRLGRPRRQPPRLRGARLGILTSTGGGGSLIADACGVHGFTTPPPTSRLSSVCARYSWARPRPPIATRSI